MAVQKWHLSLWLLLMLILFNGAALNKPKEPQDVKFISQNFQSVLHWKPGNGAENLTTYFVQHQIYGKQWSNKTECCGIKETFCDLTQETNPTLEFFFARVRAHSFYRFSNWTRSETFCPMTDKTEVISFEESILIKVIAPRTVLKMQNDSLKSVEDIYPEVKYNITVSVKAQDQIGLEDERTYITKNKTFKIQHLSPGTAYCVSVQTTIPYYNPIGKPSKVQCVTLAGPSTRIIQSVIICSAVGTLALVTLSIYLYFKHKYSYVPKPHLPAMLTTWNRKEPEDVVFSPQIIAQTNINKWEFTELSKDPSTSLLQNRYIAQAHCKKYINIESPDRFRSRDFGQNSMHLDAIILWQYLEQLQFICSDYAQMMVEPDSLLSVDHQDENVRLQWVSTDCCQCQLCCQNKEEFQAQEAGTFQGPTQLLAPGYPDYINHDFWEDPIPNNWV
ncbi:interleukin-20 receptor subunit alpha-like isoform X2 [Heterodontus francisci]|uniref:interleukin-20 receptor subunit alpha-like isoform X2 n=1 Tax=Heterodontus francisci TaxID=7792 RepID=UPI00355C5803